MKTKVDFQGHEVWQLSHGGSRILVAPDYGARLLTWNVRASSGAERTIIYWPQNPDWSQLAGVRGGNPVLFPFVARHMVNGVIGRWQDAEGRIYDLPMHGFARNLPFEVIEDDDPHSLRMRLTDTPRTLECYPFPFVFDVIYRVSEGALETCFETTNTGEAPLPYYAGHHFYFALPHEERPLWRLTLPCRRWGRQNPDGSVRFETATQESFTLDDSTLIDRFHLDFVSPEISLEHRQDNRRIVIDLGDAASTSWYAVTTWTEKPESDFFCIEPWLGLPNAIHHGYGLRSVKSGATETAVCQIRVQDL